MKGYIYVGSYRTSPNLIEIRKSENSPVGLARLTQPAEISSPYRIEYSVFCNNFDHWEIAVRDKLSGFIETGERELYKVGLSKVISIIKELIGDDVLLEEQCDTSKDLIVTKLIQVNKSEAKEVIRRTMTYSDGARYEGELKNGKFHGWGKMIYSQGDSFEGIWEDGTRQGKGIYKWHDGQKYEGMFENGQFHGQGKMSYPEGQKYEGMFENGQFHGQGKMSYPEGQKYEGMFKCGSFHGLGEISYPTGQKYKGEFKDDKPHGTGTYTWPSGQTHEGEWRDGKKYDPLTDGIVLAMGISTLVLM